jgi:hypothetical protein
MKFAKHTFLIAGIYGVLVLLPQYFMEHKNGQDFPPPITHPEYFYGFIGVALAWQFAFLTIARNPAQYRLLMIPAAFEKASFGVAVIALFLLERVSAFIVGFAAIDLILGALFIVSYIKTSAIEISAK